MLLEKVPAGSGSVGAGIVLPELVMVVMARIGHSMKTKDLIDVLRAVTPLPLPEPIF